MTDGATTSLPTLTPGRRTPSGCPRRVCGAAAQRPLLNLGGWLLFGVAWGTGRFLEWEVFVAIKVPYILTGFLLSLLLGFLYDRLRVGPAFFGRSLAIIVWRPSSKARSRSTTRSRSTSRE